jgi:3-hydroxy-5-methyl-1-naphthoate 3-O-methyltransferase
MSVIVLELEPFCKVAIEYISKTNLQVKVKTEPLDLREPLPSGYDVAFMSNILHDYDKEKGTFLLKKILDSMTNDGVILISEWLIKDEKTGPAFPSLMRLNMIVESNGRRYYSFAEISKMLNAAAFNGIEKRPLARPAELVIGCKQ